MSALLPADIILGKNQPAPHPEAMLSLPHSPVGFFVVFKFRLSLNLNVFVHNHSSLGTASFAVLRTMESLNP